MALLTFDSLPLSRPDSTPLVTGLTCSLTSGLIGLVGANGSGKSTLLRVVAGDVPARAGHLIRAGTTARLRQSFAPEESIACLFGKAGALDRLDRAAAGRGTAEDLAEADWTLESRLETALARVGLGAVDSRVALGRLSGGQQRRAALAALFFECPEIVLLDEPTNDLDAEGRQIVRTLLDEHRGRGLALVASHDRALLDGMDRILALEAGSAQLHTGGWSTYEAARTAARARAEARLERADRAVSAVESAIGESARKSAGRARQGRALRTSGSHGKMLTDAMRDRAESRGAGAARLAERKRSEARVELEEARAALPPTMPRRLDAAPDARRHGTVLDLRDVSFRFGEQAPVVKNFSMDVRAGERVALVGPNGSGKSTLLRLCAGLLEADAGAISRGSLAFLDQQTALLGEAGTLADAFARHHPGLGRNTIHAALARMGFRGAAGNAEVAGLSGGERMQAALALVLAGASPPDLLVLDEPTNHLDIPALEAVEAGLSGHAGAMLVVSHDAAFLDRLAPIRRVTLPGCG
ncbi:ABC-F family ATP-binding cassette domain-containing protein [Tropicimonas aquimaris]|uniref:ATP-binding cassette domain-containing protein n=1 Tax=Tropicimonas aquimaris TaxID=914152 RepID=A0ABW3ISY2_9RHOB